LQAFAEGTGQLSEEHLHKLVREFYMNTRFDAATDRLVNTNIATPSAPLMPPRWSHPDPAVREAQAALDAALAAAKQTAAALKAQAPLPGNIQPSVWPLPRAGFQTDKVS
jgi:hypothetical protein